MFTCITKYDEYYDAEGGIKYSIKFQNFKYYAIPIINVHFAGPGYDFYKYYEIESLRNETTIRLGESFKSEGNDGSAVCLTKISKKRIDIIYSDVFAANEAAENANKEFYEYIEMPFWKRDILDYRIPEKYHAQIQKLAEESHDDFDFRLRDVDGVEHCAYFVGDNSDGFDIYTNELLVHYEPQTWTCERCGRTMTTNKFTKGKFTYGTTPDCKRTVKKYCEDCVDKDGKIKSDEKTTKIPVPVKKTAAIKPKRNAT